MFNAFINNLDDETECDLRKFMDDTRLEGGGNMADMLEGRAVIQKDLDRLEKGVDRSISKEKSKSCS